MKLTRFTNTTARSTAAGLTILAVSLISGIMPGSAQSGRNGQMYIVKDCNTFSGVPGASYCHIVNSNFPELPVGTKIYYDQITGGPNAGSAGYLDSNIFVYVSDSQWAVGRCTVTNANPPGPVGICTLSDGFGPLAGFTARVTVTYQPGGDGFLYDWDGTYSFNSLPGK